MRHDDEGEGEYIADNDYDDYEEPTRSPSQKRKDILKLMGNKKKLVTKADGLSKEIPISEDRRKRKLKSKSKRKIKRSKK
jgi:hypothetical protein